VTANYTLKEDIRDYWSRRSLTFDLAFGHRIPPGPELEAWGDAVTRALGDRPLSVLELACGTGEVSNVLMSRGHRVTALDFSEAMLSVARAKHAGRDQVHFILADAENTMEPDGLYDAIVCRHLVWTLTRPEEAFADWFRVLKPGGRLLVFDGDWAKPTHLGRLAGMTIKIIDRLKGEDPHYDGAMGDRHRSIMSRLPFGHGLTAGELAALLRRTGFVGIDIASHAPIAAAQRRTADLRNCLRTLLYRRFILSCRKPDAA